MKQNILLITSEFPPLPGGIGNHAFFLAKYLQKNSFDVLVVSDFRDEKADAKFDEQQNFRIFRVKRNSFTQINRIKNCFSLAKENEIIICSGKFSLWTGAFLKSFFKSKKIIAVLHGSELKAGNSVLQKLTKYSLSKFDKLIAVSNFTKNYALQINPDLKIDVINNGIEINPKIEKPEKPEQLNLVTVGNLTFRKGQQNMIKALPLLKETFPNIHYNSIGIPTEKEKFSKLAKSLNVLENVTFYGALSENEKNEILRKSTVFVMLSDIVKNDFEGFGIAILEANVLGIPAIGSQNSGIADAIQDGYSGKLVNPHSPEEIKLALEDIITNYEQYKLQAKEWSSQFDWSKVIQKYIAVLES
ncbi:glycosyltransferase family 4 protein [Flavobacterium adhaerens]|uniref:glycosyltransferase family 4 protein n=1 Tax=Flavobacterium adhaerens TaxID=3149043 RepID=UPI0032B46064